MKKNWTKIALVLGPVILMASVTWEYARTEPAYAFLIQPWSIRGYEITHGWIIFTMGVLLAIGALATSWEGSLSPRISAGVSGYLVVAATAFTAYFTIGTDRAAVTFTVSTVTNVLISLFVAVALSLALRSLFRERFVLFKRALPVFAVTFFALYFLIAATVAGSEISAQAWLLVFVVFLLMAGVSIAIKPNSVAANRMMIFTSVAAWVVVALSAGAIRQTLVDAQFAFVQSEGVTGVAAQYRDTQAANGWWLAGFGTTVLFVGAVGLWARRRDVVAALARAKRQRAAAEESAREIQEALEAYEREQAAKA